MINLKYWSGNENAKCSFQCPDIHVLYNLHEQAPLTTGCLSRPTENQPCPKTLTMENEPPRNNTSLEPPKSYVAAWCYSTLCVLHSRMAGGEEWREGEGGEFAFLRLRHVVDALDPCRHQLPHQHLHLQHHTVKSDMFPGYIFRANAIVFRSAWVLIVFFDLFVKLLQWV